MKDINDLIDLSEESDDDLSTLEDMFQDLSVDGPSKEQLYAMYGVFLKDFIKNPMIIDGKNLKVNVARSKHPLCKGKLIGFEHIITRENKYKGLRDFDSVRANKIHWIKIILSNAADKRIKYFEAINDKGLNQKFYWYEKKSFIIILREINPDVMLITAFSIDTGNENKYKYLYEEHKKTSLRK